MSKFQNLKIGHLYFYCKLEIRNWEFENSLEL